MIKFDFHITKKAREKYKIDKSLFSITGNLIIANYQQARILSENINFKRREEGNVDEFVTAGQINALGLLHEIFHLLIRKYEENDNLGVFNKAITHLKDEISENGFEKTLLAFVEEFPPLPVYYSEVTPEAYLTESTGGKPNAEIVFEEIILLHIQNSNPAGSKLRELYSDDNLKLKSNYTRIIEKTEEFFDKEAPTRLGGLHLFKLLKNNKLLDSSKSFSGAGGGLPFVFQNFYNADILSSQEFIENILNIKEYKNSVDILITGEGAYDAQSELGKGAGLLVKMFSPQSEKVFLICGRADKKSKEILPPNVHLIELNKYFSSNSESIRNYEKGIHKACEEIRNQL